MRTRSTILGSIALLSLAVYIVACRVSFSPDGKRLLVPYVESSPRGTAVALVDRATGASRCIFATARVQSDGPAPDLTALTAQWTPDGSRAVIFYPDAEGTDHIGIASVPIDGPGETRLFACSSEDTEDSIAMLAVPPPIVGNHAFISGARVLRLDLRTGEIRKGGPAGAEGVIVSSEGSRLVYWAHNVSGMYEWGTLDPATLATTPLMKIPAEAAGKLGMFAAASPDGTRLAAVIEDADKVLVFKDGALERTFERLAGEKTCHIGNVLWSHDGKALYAAVMRDEDQDIGSGSYAVLELPAGGGAPRELLVLKGDVRAKSDEAMKLVFQVGLSPDGKTLAVTGTLLDVEEKDRALFLIDLASPGRDVRKVPIPGAASPGD